MTESIIWLWIAVSYFVCLVVFGYLYYLARKWAVQNNNELVKFLSGAGFLFSTYVLPIIPPWIIVTQNDRTSLGLVAFMYIFASIPIVAVSSFILLGINKKIEDAESLLL